jgi:hypothetical protein
MWPCCTPMWPRADAKGSSRFSSRGSIGTISGRLMPSVDIDSQELVLLMPSITNVPVAELGRSVGNLTAYRSRIVDAIDAMFLGI